MWQIWIDTGGTFTDCLGLSPGGQRRQVKILSNSTLRADWQGTGPGVGDLRADWIAPDGFADGWIVRPLTGEGTARLGTWTRREQGSYDVQLEAGGFLPDGPVEVVCPFAPPILGARLLTRTPAAHNLPPLALRLATTRATNALLEHKGARTVLVTTVGLGDLPRIGNQQRADLFAPPVDRRILLTGAVEIPLRADAEGVVFRDWSEEERAEMIRRVGDLAPEAVAVSLIHSYREDRLEKEVVEALREAGHRFIAQGAELSPLIKLGPRTETAVVDAYLQPIMKTYLDEVERALGEGTMLVMNSAGGLVPRDRYHPKDSLLSGPAGGVMGAVRAAQQAGYAQGIGFDMGGTSTDVTRWDGTPGLVNETRIGEARVLAPALQIETVAAGGGSICAFDGQRLRVGPESAGASPGPACYGAGGPLTLTDVHLLLGRMDPGQFGIPVFPEAAEAALAALLREMEEAGQAMSREALLKGFLALANETMAGAIRKITLQEGYAAEDYPLVAFGGAGGLHACALASLLGIETVIFPPEAGLLSAAGLGAAVPTVIVQRQILRPWAKEKEALSGLFKAMEREALGQADNPAGWTVREHILALRIQGQETEIEVSWEGDGDRLEAAFGREYTRIFGAPPVAGQDLELVRLRLVVSAPVTDPAGENFPPVAAEPRHQPSWSLDELPPHTTLAGPSLLQNRTCSFFLEEGWVAQTGDRGTLRVQHRERERKEEKESVGTGEEGEALRLALFTHRFTAIAREMGEQLRRTALSTNIKERLDFSCALVDAEGQLIVNAPHVPVHLGSLGLCVREVTRVHTWKPGEVMVTNHPRFGGSHLPDLTVITPIFMPGGEMLGFAVNRAHHAEMGGRTPGSMPPHARTLEEEGVILTPTLLRDEKGEYWDQLEKILSGGPWPSRAVTENLLDLRAQVAANERGRQLWMDLADKEGVETVRHYGRALRHLATREAIQCLRERVSKPLAATQSLDDGTTLAVTWSPLGEDRWMVDFSGTATVHPGNFNATPGIVRSALLYVLCRMIGDDFPLNEGLLEVVGINLPEGLLNPPVRSDDRHPAVVAGNVETSQRLVDTLLLLFQEEACSQGTMNNIVFGGRDFRLYETIGGGCGARADQPGASGVHSHMTNTAITDPEILEYRYPVRLEAFALRRGSGGIGQQNGGDGLCREIRFLAPVTLSLLTQHRREKPYGLAGGGAGACGRQWIRRRDGTLEEIEGCFSGDLEPGEAVRVETPGGGGYGAVRSKK